MRHLIKRSLKFRVMEPARALMDHAIASVSSRPVTRVSVVSDDLVYTSEQQIAPLCDYRDALRAQLGVVVARSLVGDALSIGSAQLRGSHAILLKLAYHTPAREVLAIARALRERAGASAKLIYLDGDDDPCVQWPELLPLVDLYVKKQIFADAAEYERDRIGKTNLTDYAARTFGRSFAGDRVPFSRGVDPSQVHKITLGWNLALDRKIRALRRTVVSAHPKDIDVSCRANLDPSIWIHPFREPVARILRSLDGEYRVLTPENRVSQDEYYLEMRRSRICVSPFGYGEICWRDFEAILCGCLLVKPDVGHLRTEPDLFLPLETYVPVRWDFADLEEVLRHYLTHPEERERICRQALERLLAYYDGGFVRSVARVLAAAGISTGAGALSRQEGTR